MAITHSIKFTASAKDAISEIQKYEDKIVATAQTVDKHANSLGGSKILAQANNWTAAVAKLGGATDGLASKEQVLAGATKLTAAEQERLNRTLDQAITKYTALGKTAPTAMTDLYEATKKVPTAIDQTQTGVGGLMAKLGPLGPMIATTFSVGAVIGFAKELLATADATVKMADKTGMSIEAVQRLGFIAEQSGNSLDQVSSAVSQLQRRLADGDKGAVAALHQLGIEQERFMAMSPDQQFMEVARAVKSVEDPMERARIAFELFGKSGTEMLPTLIANVDELAAQAPVMSAKATKAFDDIGDSISRLTSKLKIMVGEGLALAMDSYGRLAQGVGQVMSGQFAKAAETLLDLETELPKVAAHAKGLTIATTGVALSMEDADKIGKELTDQLKDQGKAAKTTAESQLVLSRALSSVAINAGVAVPKLSMLNGQLVGLGAATKDALPWLGWSGENANGTLMSRSLDMMMAKLPPATAGIVEMGSKTAQATGSMRESVGKAVDVFNLLSRTAEMAGHSTTAAWLSAGSAIAQSFASGGVWGAAITGIGLAITALWNKFGKGDERKVNDLRDAFIDAAGGLAALNAKAQQAGMTLNALLNAKTVKDYEAAVAALNTKLAKTAAMQGELAGLQAQLANRQVMDWQRAQELIEKYGGTLGDLGKQFADAKQAADWKSIWDDWQTLLDMGADMGGVLGSMKDEIGALVQESLRIGTEIPEQFKPLIAELIRTGQLFDANGKAITDISQLKFGPPLVSEVDKIVTAIDKLVAALTDHLIPTIGTIPRQIRVKVGYEYDEYAPPKGGIQDPDADYGGTAEYAGGTHGRYLDFGAGTPVVLHGRERVMTEAEGRSGWAGPGRATFTPRGSGRESTASGAGQAVNVSITIQALDPVGLKQVVERDVVPLLVSAYRRNVNGARTETRKELVD